jgi:hypothetical protein
MWPIAKANFLFEETNRFLGFAGDNQAVPFQLAEHGKYLNALPGCPNDLNFRKSIEYPNGPGND